MSKLSDSVQVVTVFCGIDVSAATLAVAIQQDDHRGVRPAETGYNCARSAAISTA